MASTFDLWKAAVAVGGLLLLLVGGTAGFHFVEGWSWWDSFFMVLISVTTVGYGEVHPLSQPGQMVASVVIIGGVGVGAYVLLFVTRHVFEGIVEGTFTRARARRRELAAVAAMSGHTIVCGYGRLGREICAGLKAEAREVVVIDTDPSVAEDVFEQGLSCIVGDAADEELLKQAGVANAGSIAVATREDAMNTYIVLAARELNPDARIIARASTSVATRRLLRSGASQVISPARLGGRRMASMLIRPSVVDFMDLAELGEYSDLFIEKLELSATSDLAGKSLVEANYAGTYHVLVLAVRGGDGEMRFAPPASDPLNPGDLLIVAGHRKDLTRLEEALGAAA